MPGEAVQPDFDNIEAEAEQPQGRPHRIRRLAVMASVAVLLLSSAGLGAAWSLGLLGQSEGVAEAPPVFFELPEMTVNLSTLDERPQYLKLSAALEMQDEDMLDSIEPVLPRVLDAFQVYLRQLRPSDLEGSAGIYRLKEELVRRVNIAIHPAEIDGVAFNEILVQ